MMPRPSGKLEELTDSAGETLRAIVGVWLRATETGRGLAAAQGVPPDELIDPVLDLVEAGALIIHHDGEVFWIEPRLEDVELLSNQEEK